MFNGVGYYSARCFWKLDQRRNYSSVKKSKIKARQKATPVIATANHASSGEEDDSSVLRNDEEFSMNVLNDGIEKFLISDTDDGDDYEPGGDD